jgi:type IV secretory pathway TraG/TraD family ATPase VirD4
VLIHWAAQSLAKLEDVYTPPRARQLLDNTTTLTVWGGLKDQRALEWVSLLTGHHDRLRYQQHSDGILSPGRTAVGTETVPTYRPGAIRTVPRGRVLVIHRNLPPILARAVDVTKRPDWAAIRADIQAVRAESAPVNHTGYALTPPGPAFTAAPEGVSPW